MTTIVERRATHPNGDLACDFELARGSAGLREELGHAIVVPARLTERGVEVMFEASARDLVLRYIDMESRCCSFLDLAARDEAGHVILTVEGRPEARDMIANLFTAP